MNDSRFKEELLEVISLMTRDQKTLDAFLRDLLTPTEYREMIIRWQIVKLLATGSNQRDAAFDLKVGISTVTRGARMLANPTGGFNQALDKLGIKRKED